MTLSPERIEEALAAAKLHLLRHDGQFYGPMKDERCGCPECLIIRPLAAALREAQAENERLNEIADAAEALIERTITDMMEVARREVRLSALLRQRRNRLAALAPADEAKP